MVKISKAGHTQRQLRVTERLTSVWAALSDPTRREILDLLRERLRTTGELADELPTSRFAIMKEILWKENKGISHRVEIGRQDV